jgi:hypothetical protein
MLAHLRSLDVDIVTMDEVHQRLPERANSRGRFACFTLRRRLSRQPRFRPAGDA